MLLVKPSVDKLFLLTALCPHVEPPCNTRVVGPIAEQNRTENSIIRFWPDPGWVSPDKQPLETRCINSDWDPTISWLGVERMLPKVINLVSLLIICVLFRCQVSST